MSNVICQIKLKVCKAQMLFSALAKSTFQKKIGNSSGNILLIYSGGLGDVILDIQSIKKVVDKFYSDGKKVSILALKSNCELFEVFFSPQEVTLVPCDFLRMDYGMAEGRRAFRKIVKTLSLTSWECIIVRFNRLDIRSMLIAAAIPAISKKAFLFSQVHCQRKEKFFCWLIDRTFDEVIQLSENLTQMQLSREFARCLGVEHYPIKITHLPAFPFSLPIVHHYITVAVDSSGRVKQWGAEKFIKLIQILIEDFPYDVVLTGINVLPDEKERYQVAFDSNTRIVNMIGKTTVVGWIELIRGAQFHVGVDSSSIHIAASVGTQSFVLTGVWDDQRFFPYQIDAETPETAIPVAIFRKDVDIHTLPCKNCNSCGGFGFGNEECRERCIENRSCLCLEKIAPMDVMDAIRRSVAEM